MSDESLRQLERAFRVSGAPADEARLLRARLRQGDLALGEVGLQLAAYLGHEAAVIACDEEQIEVPMRIRARLSHLPPAERDYWEQVSLSIPLVGPGVTMSGAHDALARLRRPAWCHGLARFGPEACVRALVAGAPVLAQGFPPEGREWLAAAVEIGGAAVARDPTAVDRAAARPVPAESLLMPVWVSIERAVCSILLTRSPHATERLAGALSAAFESREAGAEDAFRAAVSQALLPWALRSRA